MRGVSITNDDFICTVHSGVVIDHWPSLRQHGLFTNANQWRARVAKHGSVYRSWDPSDFTVRMLLQKWRADLSSFWDNGSWANPAGSIASWPVQEYQRSLSVHSFNIRTAFVVLWSTLTSNDRVLPYNYSAVLLLIDWCILWTLRRYNRLYRTLISRPVHDTVTAVAEAATSDESQSEEEVIEAFVPFP